MSLELERIDRKPVVPVRKIELPLPFQQIPLHVVALIFKNLDVVSWNRLRAVSKGFQGYVDDYLLHQTENSQLFQQVNCSSLPIDVAARSFKVLYDSAEKIVVKADDKILSIDKNSQVAETLCEGLPSEKELICTQGFVHFYFKNNTLTMVDQNGQRYDYDTSQAFVEPGDQYTDFEKRFLRDCSKPQNVYRTHTDDIICVTRGGTLLRWTLRDPCPKEVRELVKPQLEEFQKALNDSRRWRPWNRNPNYPSAESIPVVKAVFSNSMVILHLPYSIQFFDLETCTLMFRVCDEYFFDINVIDKYLFVQTKDLSNRFAHNLGVFKIEDKTVIKKYTIPLSGEWFTSSNSRILDLTGNFLIATNSLGLVVVDVISGKEITHFKFKNNHMAFKTHDNHKFFLFDHSLIMINELDMEISFFSIPSLKCVSTVKLDQVSDDFSYLSVVGGYLQLDGGVEVHQKIYPKDVLKFTNVIYQNGEFLFSYEFKKPGTELTSGKILSIKDGNKNTYVPPPPKAPVIVKEFPAKKVALIGLGSGIAIISTILFACLTYRSNSTSLYKSLAGRGIMIVSALNVGTFLIGGTVFSIRNKPKRRPVEELIDESPDKIVRVKVGLFTTTLVR